MTGNVTKKQIAKFIFLPGVFPRIKELGLNLHWLAYMMALVFSATRILPPNHPYTSRSEFGKFGIADILFEAGRHLKGGFRHIDHYIIYGSFVLAVILLIGQFAVLLFVLATHTADAAWSGMFSTQYRSNDLALMMLDKVFEVPNMFGSKFNPVNAAGITSFGNALHGIFSFYNQGMLMIGALIVLYYIFAVVVETMQTGTPFGQRFQEVFVPIRICLAVLLLLPLGYGFSAGQLLVLKLADWGSGFATNGWIIFNKKAGDNPLGGTAMQLVVSPKTQEIEDLLRYYSMVHSCRAIYKLQYDKDIEPYVIVYNQATTQMNSVSAKSLNYAQALKYFPETNMKITFGEKQDRFDKYPGKVKPYCGTIDVPTVNYELKGAYYIQQAYWEYLGFLWTNTLLNTYGDRMAKISLGKKVGVTADSSAIPGWPDPNLKPEVGYYANVRSELQAIFANQMAIAKNQIRNDPDSKMTMNQDLLAFGWGGAGIWFNKIAEYNGAIMTANTSIPVPSSYPMAMARILMQKRTTDGSTGNLTQFIATFGNGATLKDMMSGGKLDDPAIDGQIAIFLGDTFNSMSEGDTYGDGAEAHDNNVLANVFNMIFGTEGLFELRGNQEIHPLAKMSALGRSILDRAATYLGGAMIMGGLSGLSTLLDNGMQIESRSSFSSAFAGIGSMFLNFATIGITVGVVLYYVIPFLPFLYFFFAVGRWVKSIFEACVGIPLWALAHLRIDGEGIPGPAAANGYFLMLEIFLRPILVILGLMASVACFSALAIGLDSVFDLVTKNVTGYSPIDSNGAYSYKGVEFRRGDIDAFFYTVVYAVLLYLMALSCFKLIDLIPNSVLRFIGTGVNEFTDQMNLESDIIRYTGLASYSMTKEAGEAAMEAGQAIGRGAALPGNMAIDMKQKTDAMERANKAAQAAKAQGGGGTPSGGEGT